MARGLGAFFRKNECKLIATVSRRGIDTPAIEAKNIGQPAQRAASHQVAMNAVDLLQAIDVQEKEDERSSRSFRTFDLRLEGVDELPVVSQSREGVTHRKGASFAFGAPAFRNLRSESHGHHCGNTQERLQQQERLVARFPCKGPKPVQRAPDCDSRQYEGGCCRFALSKPKRCPNKKRNAQVLQRVVLAAGDQGAIKHNLADRDQAHQQDRRLENLRPAPSDNWIENPQKQEVPDPLPPEPAVPRGRPPGPTSERPQGADLRTCLRGPPLAGPRVAPSPARPPTGQDGPSLSERAPRMEPECPRIVESPLTTRHVADSVPAVGRIWASVARERPCAGLRAPVPDSSPYPAAQPLFQLFDVRALCG